MKTIIYTHPYSGSFNHAILQSLTDYFDRTNQEYQVIDLYQDNFNPQFSADELKMYSRGDTPYQLVKGYQDKIKASNELIFVTPIWWHNIPAELKGFLIKLC
jgi:Putative NADPH-quinone reductase (modulator of drug activity B)